MDGLCLLVELRWERSAPLACAVGLFKDNNCGMLVSYFDTRVEALMFKLGVDLIYRCIELTFGSFSPPKHQKLENN